jgi:predicted nucleotidyltransferase
MEHAPVPKRLKSADGLVTPLLHLFSANARSAGCQYFLAGELAAELMTQRPPAELRATTEIEFGIAVGSQEHFELFKERLIATGEFVSAKGASHRLFYLDGDLYEDSHGNRGWIIQVDLIPFIGTPAADSIVAPPASREQFMNVSGFAVLQSSILIEAEEGFTMHVASLAGLTLLALTAWVYLGQETCEAAGCLARLLIGYELENKDLWEQELNLLETVRYDEELAAVALHGRNVAGTCETQMLSQLRSFLSTAANRQRLVSDVSRWIREQKTRDSHTKLAEALRSEEMARLAAIVEAFCVGFLGLRCGPERMGDDVLTSK